MVPSILSRSQTLQQIKELGHVCKSSLGQNFLVDGNIVRRSLEYAELSAGETVVEVGPGLGTLTAALLSAGVTVYAIEKDPGLFTHLKENLCPHFPALYLMQGDAVDTPTAGVPIHTPFKIVANLPYAISTPWMERVLWGALPVRMTLMLQKEAALRFIATEGKNYGPISILLALHYRVAATHAVPRTCFHPAPDVESMLLTLVPCEDPFTMRPETYTLVREVFCHRRKQIQSLGRYTKYPLALKTWIQECGISPKERPENIPLKDWKNLDGFVQNIGA